MGEIDELYKALEVSNAEGLKLDTENVRLRHTVAVQVATIAKAEARIVELKEEVEHERNEKLTISEVDKSTIDFMREIMTKLKQEKAELDREIANFKATLTDANLYTLKLLDRIAELEAALAAAIELADLQAVDITELKRANAVLAGAMDKADAQVGRVSRENADLQDELREVTAAGMRDGAAGIAWYQKYQNVYALLQTSEAEVLKLQDILAAIAYALDVTPDYPDFNYVTSTFEFVKMKLHQLRDEILKRGETIALYRDKLIAAAKEETCEWKQDTDEWVGWESNCGLSWDFINEGPVQNECVYCPRCGKKIAVVIEPKEEKNER